MSRPSWAEYFLDLAAVVATRATCARKQVGAVLTSHDNRVISVGYNGSPSDHEHCTSVGCMMEDGHCVRTIHAEVNALLHVREPDIRWSHMYITCAPCWGCYKLLVQRGVMMITFKEAYRMDTRVIEAAKKDLVTLRQL